MFMVLEFFDAFFSGGVYSATFIMGKRFSSIQLATIIIVHKYLFIFIRALTFKALKKHGNLPTYVGTYLVIIIIYKYLRKYNIGTFDHLPI